MGLALKSLVFNAGGLDIAALRETWNDPAKTFEGGINLDIDDQASAADSLPIKVSRNGDRIFSLRKDGRLEYGPDASNHWTHTVDAAGGLTMQGSGAGGKITISPTSGQDIVLNPTGSGNIQIKNNIRLSSSTRLETANSVPFGNLGANSWALYGADGVGLFSFDGALFQAVVLKKSGNVGVGLTDPATKLDVNGAITGREMATPPTAGADRGILFFQDNGAGKTQLMVQFPTGAAQEIAIEA